MIKEAEKKLFFLVARPLRVGRGVAKGMATKKIPFLRLQKMWPLRSRGGGEGRIGRATKKNNFSLWLP